jgi:hypothetical protein
VNICSRCEQNLLRSGIITGLPAAYPTPAEKIEEDERMLSMALKEGLVG